MDVCRRMMLRLCVVVVLVAFSRAVPVKNQISDDDQKEFEAALNQSQAMIEASKIPGWSASWDPFAKWHKPLPEPHWSACTHMPILQKTCLGVYAKEKDLSVGAFLMISGSSIMGHKAFAANITLELGEANHFCMKDTDILMLVELIPVLTPFKPVIDKIVKTIGKIPVHLFSVCAKLSDMHFSKQAITGSAELDNNIMCGGLIKTHCLCSKKCTINFGNFTIPL